MSLEKTAVDYNARFISCLAMLSFSDDGWKILWGLLTVLWGVLTVVDAVKIKKR
jgi:hypothetical protein